MKIETRIEAERKSSKWIWGTFFLLAAAIVVANQFEGLLEEIGVISIIIAVLALAFLVQCLAKPSFSPLPIPIAVLYYILQKPLDWPELGLWTLVLAAVSACIGISILLPRRWQSKLVHVTKDELGALGVYNDLPDGGRRPPPDVETDTGNNPVIHSRLGHTSRYIHAEALERAVLNCELGALEVYFDEATPAPGGAEIICHCRLGAIELYIPKHWRLIDELNCTLGGIDVSGRSAVLDENAPVVTIKGSVSLGGMEIRRV
ncbi:MAG: hypothetical protein FWG72_09240 [Oscillospiraceae bacterium]|nr:hypothetical protein [Oscillospiraceae bacterium]